MQESAQTTAIVAVSQIITQVINTWKAQNNAVNTVFSQYDKAAYGQPVATGRNRALYLLGHLTAFSDGLLPLMDIGPRLFPELPARFVATPDQADTPLPTLAELKQQWDTVTATLAAHFSQMAPQDWLEKHTNVSAEDFAKDPLRNKLALLLNRTNHQSYHLGQLAFLKPREVAA